MPIQPHSCTQTNPPTSYLPPKLFSRALKLAFPVALQSALVAHFSTRGCINGE